MESTWDSWLQSPSGSGANYDTWQNESHDYDDPFSADVVTSSSYQDEETLVVNAYGANELGHGQLMSPKVPPAWNGRGSWFAFEELVFDWEDITILDQEKRGPALKNRLCDEAAVYKPMLDRARLKDETHGVDYFLKMMRENFVKGVQNVFLFRLFQLGFVLVFLLALVRAARPP